MTELPQSACPVEFERKPVTVALVRRLILKMLKSPEAEKIIRQYAGFETARINKRERD